MIESLCRIYIALIVIVGGIISAPIPCDHVWGYRAIEAGVVANTEIIPGEMLTDARKKELKRYCSRCGGAEQEYCQHEMESCTDASTSGDSYIIYGSYSRCKKCGYRTSVTPWYGGGIMR